MINLYDLFTNAPTITLLEPRGTTPYFLKSIRLLVLDGDQVWELTVTADLMTSRESFEDEGCLALSLSNVEAPGFSRECGEFVDDGYSPCFDKDGPRVEWIVTPGGEEIDLRGDGLFG